MTATPHDHRTHVPGCFRCELSADEATATPARDWGNRVHGRCPACGSNGSLFVAVGGHVTCSLDKCPNPTSVADLLEAWRPTADQLRAMGGEITWPDPECPDCNGTGTTSFSGRPEASPDQCPCSAWRFPEVGGR